jgi:predicted RNA binding protein with dsRBD fold (UPF0201 family)
MPLVTVKAPCLPTEDAAKVKKAILNLFPDSLIEEEDGTIIAKTGSLGRFKELVRSYRILDATRRIMLHGKKGSGTSFMVNKQVAYVGKISYVEDEKLPLGSIEVSIEDDDLDHLIDEVAPVTVNGEEVLS